jgi:hypothetical protein
LVYIGLGSVFAGSLSNSITVEGLEGALGNAVKPLVTGATWTSYLSVLGFRNEKKGKKDAESRVDSLSKDGDPKMGAMPSAARDLKQKKESGEDWSDEAIDVFLDDFLALSNEVQGKLQGEP